MTEHKYAQVLRWVADGKKVQAQTGGSAWMEFPTDFNEKALAAVMNGSDLMQEHEFRLAPSGVNVGGVEIEAPLKECEQSEAVFFALSDGDIVGVAFDKFSTLDTKMLTQGKLFATREAAKAAHDAWVKLMTGESNG